MTLILDVLAYLLAIGLFAACFAGLLITLGDRE